MRLPVVGRLIGVELEFVGHSRLGEDHRLRRHLDRGELGGFPIADEFGIHRQREERGCLADRGHRQFRRGAGQERGLLVKGLSIGRVVTNGPQPDARRDRIAPKIGIVGALSLKPGQLVLAEGFLPGEVIEIVLRIEHQSETPLFLLVEASDTHSAAFGTRQRRQKHAGQNSDNRNDHQQLDEGEPAGARTERWPAMDALH